MHIDDTAILCRKLAALFADPEQKEEANNILQSYGTERYEKEPERVRLAVLKLADAKLDEIRKYIGYAKQDYRDVLAWAEYPRQMKHPSILKGPDRQRLVAEDRAEYEAWLEK